MIPLYHPRTDLDRLGDRLRAMDEIDPRRDFEDIRLAIARIRREQEQEKKDELRRLETAKRP